MAEPLTRSLRAVRIDENREYIEFRFSDEDGKEQAIRIEFDYLESLAALFHQAFVSSVMTAHHGPSRSLGRDYVSVPRVDIEYPISVAVDVMTERFVAMFMLGTPFQGFYSMPTEIARRLSGDLLDACSEVGEERLAN